MRPSDPSQTRRNDRPGGFTLTELLVVMAIIGILIAFVLVASQDGVRRAQEKATLSLISKLEAGLADRVEAISLRQADVASAHLDLSATYNTASVTTANPSGATPSRARAQVIAQFDLFRAELPDCFFIQATNANYPINFGGIDYPIGSGNYAVPLGGNATAVAGDPNAAIGVYGATFQAAASLYKNLGYLPAGYDAADNNGNGLVDEHAEGVNTTNSAQVTANLAAHTHKTARAEMLYALLVEGVGPIGSVFNRDDFTAKEVQDTDGDGLPEFVDAWGEPLRFYRWPIYYNNVSNTTVTTNGFTSAGAINGYTLPGYVQKGMDFYNGFSEARQVDPLDPNQTLVSPAWWSSAPNATPTTLLSGSTTISAFDGGSAAYSWGARGFMTYFHSILDPNPGTTAPSGATYWDRGGFYARRAFYSRPLILSAGQDMVLGVAELNANYAGTVFPYSPKPGSPTRDASGAAISFPTGNALTDASYLIRVEGQAGAIDPNRSGVFHEKETLYGTPGSNDTSISLKQAGQDDVSNQGLASPGGGNL